MAVNKVVMNTEDGGEILIDLTKDTVTPEKLAKGYTAHDASGNVITGKAFVKDVPNYVIEEAESAIAKARSHGVFNRSIRFIAISDTHEDSAGAQNPQITVSNKHAGQAIKYISDNLSLDFIAHLGDASSCGSWVANYDFDTLCNDIKQIDNFIFSEVSGVNKVFIPGNHDQCTGTHGRLLNSGAYPLFGSRCPGNKNYPGGYGYFDIDTAKVRVIYLNTSDAPSYTGAGTYIAVSQEQKNWLCETLIDANTKDSADEWKILILSHVPLDYGSIGIPTDILVPYTNGGSYGSYSFTNHNAEIISCVYGHVHCYAYGYLADKIRKFAIPNACYLGNNHYFAGHPEYVDHGWAETTTHNKVANTGKDTAFSLVTIDLDSCRCYVDNYGAGIDRVFSTEYNPEAAIVPVSISNIRYSGGNTVGTAIDKTKFTFTVTYSNGTSGTITGATSVSPAIISEAGDNVFTVTYTEEGVSVTETFIIVGDVEVPEPISISNVTYSGDTTVGSTLDKSKFSFTVHYSDGTTASKTGATAISPTTVASLGNNAVIVDYTENGTTVSGTVTIVGVLAPNTNLLNLNRTYVSGPVGEKLDNHLDETKAYTNVPYGTRLFDAKTCTVSGITENSVTVKEAGSGGFTVAYYINLEGLNTRSLRVKFDYSGANKCRTYYTSVRSDGFVSPAQLLHQDDTNGASGSVDKVVSLNFDIGEVPTGAIIFLGSNTSGTKTFSNMSVTIES